MGLVVAASFPKQKEDLFPGSLFKKLPCSFPGSSTPSPPLVSGVLGGGGSGGIMVGLSSASLSAFRQVCSSGIAPGVVRSVAFTLSVRAGSLPWWVLPSCPTLSVPRPLFYSFS